MMRRIVASSLSVPLLISALALGLIALGFTQLRHAPVDVLPEFQPPTVEIQTEALGLSAYEVEQLITAPFEQDLLSQVPFVDTIRSESIPNLSSIELIFEPGTDLLDARQLVQERLSEALVALPGVSRPPQMLQPLSSTGRVMMVKLTSEDLSLIDMSVLARWNIRPRLMGIAGVANVSVWGHREQQLQVRVDPERLRDNNVSLLQVVETTGNALWVSPLTFLEASTPGTGGFIDTPNQRMGVQHILPITTPDDLARVAVEGTEGPLRLGDIAEVVEDHQPLIGDAVFTDGPGLLLVIEKLPEANTLEVTRRVEAAFDALRPGLAGIEIDTTVFRPATYIEQSIDGLGAALGIGAGLLALAVGALFLSWRKTAVILLSILLSVVVAALVLYFTGTTINAMVVAGLVMALGVVLNSAVADVEHISRQLHAERAAGSDRPAYQVALESTLRIRSATVLAAVTTVVATMPLFFMDPLLGGAFSREVAKTFLVATGAAMVVALTVTPALTLVLLRNAPLKRAESPLAARLERGYERLGALGPGSKTPLVVAGVLLLAALAIFPVLPRSLDPVFKDPDLLIEMEAPPATSLPEMNRMVGQAAADLKEIPGVHTVGAHVGRAITGDRIVDVNSAQLWANVDAGGSYEQTVAEIEDLIVRYPGIDADLLTYPGKRITDVLRPEHDEPVVVRIYGFDQAVLDAKATEVHRKLSGIDGIVGATIDQEAVQPVVEVEVDVAAANLHGIRPGDVRRAAATLLSGLEVGNLFEEQKVFEVVVWGAPHVRQNLTAINDLLIDTPGGDQVRLGEVADVQIRPNLVSINHNFSSRHVDVTANVAGRNLESVLGEVQRAIEGISFPLEHHAELAGDFAENRAAERQLLLLSGAAAVGVLLLLQAAVGSWPLAATLFLALPAALSGGVLATLLAGARTELGSLIGLFTVFTIFVYAALTLIRAYQQDRRKTGAPLDAEAIRMATRERLAPTLATVVATAAAFLPFVFLGDSAGLEILHPMAVATLGGLVTATLVTLLTVPGLYLRFGAGAPLEELDLGYAPVLAGETAGPAAPSEPPDTGDTD